jgi:outer membrane autotransporter protein
MSSNLLTPSGWSAGSSIGRAPSVGAYLTHAGDGMYADLLTQYRFLDYNVSTIATGDTKVTGGSVDVAAEAGAKMDMGNGMTIIPFAQLIYQHVMLPDFTAGGFDVVFGNNDALIGRIRLMAQCEQGNMKAFGSVGVSSDLLGPKTTTVSGVPIDTTLGGAQYELTAGFESSVGNNMYLFSSGEFNGAFDGSGQSYLARAGLRQQF